MQLLNLLFWLAAIITAVVSSQVNKTSGLTFLNPVDLPFLRPKPAVFEIGLPLESRQCVTCAAECCTSDEVCCEGMFTECIPTDTTCCPSGGYCDPGTICIADFEAPTCTVLGGYGCYDCCLDPSCGGLFPTSALTSVTPPPVPTTSTPTANPFTQSIPPSPAPNLSLENQTVGVNDPRITTSGPDWTATQSSCDALMQCKKCPKADETLTFNFTGQAVYMLTAKSSNAGLYIVVIDNSKPVVVDAFTNSNIPTCEFGWSAFGLQNTDHSVVVTTGGASSNMTVDTGEPPTFELEGFMITTQEQYSSSRAVSFPDMNIYLVVLLTNMIFFAYM